MRISELGEFGLIERVQEWTREPGHPVNGAVSAACRAVVDNGDDAAAVAFVSDQVTELYTTDTMVAGIHFTSETTPWRDLGWKAIASNVSDVAAMGGTPAFALVTLGLPADTLVDDVKELYGGMTEICREFGTRVIGGDMVRSPVAFITVALTGIAAGNPMVRTAARPGHLVGVTGPVGGSAGGLRAMLEVSGSAGTDREQLKLIHRRPRPHVAEGRILVANGVDSAMDVSDGLADDLGKLCAASGVAAVIRADGVPAEPALKSVFAEDWLDLALYGGEDYVLLFTAPPAVMSAVIGQLPNSAAVVGEITDGPAGTVTVLDPDGSTRHRSGAGWDHFG
ncbi:MAG: thiamine-phosphate kinase [Chloroflexota bacterium]|nr:thiamine-phosphate kinase [Chloroflexota bacterium]MDE2959388.1 thiamine-phosphate kinase [Chloroflexota bacterium]